MMERLAERGNQERGPAVSKIGSGTPEKAWLDGTRYVIGQRAGHYESYYQRANHPDRPLAFWIRYTIFSPEGRPEAAIGELWAVLFDGETGNHTVAKSEFPIDRCSFAADRLDATIAGSTLDAQGLKGRADGPAAQISWDLTYSSTEDPLLLLQRASYDRSFPVAKSLVARPLAVYDGTVVVGDRVVEVDGWVGSQNHNWGRRHTDYYAFGQVAGFDDAPDTFLEVVSAKVKVGPVRLPMVTCLSLRHRGRTHELVSPLKGMRADAVFGYFFWRFETSNDDVIVHGEITAESSDFVGLNYYNPPGGIKQCLNTKIGSCVLTVTDRRTGEVDQLHTTRRALFEILTDHRRHGVPIRA